MHELPQIIPDVKMLLALTPEELGAKMLFLLRKRNNAVRFHPGNELNELWNGFYQPRYPREHQEEIGLALAEAWAWLNAQGYSPRCRYQFAKRLETAESARTGYEK